MMKMMNMNEVAARLGICRRTAEALLANGRLPQPVRFGRLRRWLDVQIEEFMIQESEKAGGRATPAAANRGRRRGN